MGRVTRALAGLALAVAGAGLVTVAAPAPAAQAAACSGPDRVTVVVDFKSLGGGVTAGCASPGTAWNMVQAAGYPITPVARQPGFVCKVSGKPASQACQAVPPADAYWGLFWSSGNGKWSYSTKGAGALRVGDGGYVAFAWQGSNGRSYPSFKPVSRQVAQPDPEPTQAPSPTVTPSETPTPAVTESPSEDPQRKGEKLPGKQQSYEIKVKRDGKKKDPGASESTSPAAAVGDPPATAAQDAAGGEDGVPIWLIGGLAGLLVVGAGTAFAVRRRAN